MAFTDLQSNFFSRAEGLYIAWQSEAKTEAVPRVLSVQIETAFFPSIDANGRHGYYGYIFGDEEFVAFLTMSSVADARPHTGVSGANFNDPAIGKLTDHDRWTLVVQRDDGKEMLRRLLPVPDRAGRSKALAVHRNAILRAWDRCSMEQIETVTTSNKEADAEGICLLSTPASRDEINIAQI